MKTANTLSLQAVHLAYLTSALWSSTQDDELCTPFDETFGIHDFTDKAWNKALSNCGSLIYLLDEAGIVYTGTSSKFGYDFWLTRNHHGAGFWDRGGESGAAITKIVQDNFRELNLFETESGQVCME